MNGTARPPIRRFLHALVACALAGVATLPAGPVAAGSASPADDPLLDGPGGLCGPARGGQPALLKALILAKTETTPFQPAPMKAAGGDVPLFEGLGQTVVQDRHPRGEGAGLFRPGLPLAWAFNHAEAQRAFRGPGARSRLRHVLLGRGLVLGPQHQRSDGGGGQRAALWPRSRRRGAWRRGRRRTRTRADRRTAKRYAPTPRPTARRWTAAYADAMRAVPRAIPAETRCWRCRRCPDGPAALGLLGGPEASKPKGAPGATIVGALETVLARRTRCIPVRSTSTSTRLRPPTGRNARAARGRLAALMPGAGHIVHMPAHIWYRSAGTAKPGGQPRRHCRSTRRTSARRREPALPGVFPHNVHFVMVSALMAGDGPTAVEAATRLAAADPARWQSALCPASRSPWPPRPMSRMPASPTPEVILALPAPAAEFPFIRAHWHYARGEALARQGEAEGRAEEAAAIRALLTAPAIAALPAQGRPGAGDAEHRRAGGGGAGGAGARRPRRRVRLLTEAALHPGPAALHGATLLVLPGAAVAGRCAPGAGPHRRGGGGVPRGAAQVPNNGWALAGLAEVYRRKGDAKGEASARKAYARTWFGGQAPDIAKL